MGRSNQKHNPAAAKSHTLPSSPTHSSSSSDFEFTISLSPRKSSAALCPADELFYKGQLLPLHLSPRLSMVRTLLLSSASTSSSSDTTTTASRDSTASHSSSDDLLRHIYCDSSRPSSAADEDLKRLANTSDILSLNYHRRKGSKYFSLPKFSSVFRRENNKTAAAVPPPSAVKRVSSGAKEVICRYLKKVKPLYERLSYRSQQKMSPAAAPPPRVSRSANNTVFIAKAADPELIEQNDNRNVVSQSFSGNLKYPIITTRRSCISSCPSSMMSSPRHVGSGSGYGPVQVGRVGFDSDASSMEELQSAIQGAIAHCKNSMMLKNKNINIYGQ
ncbi:hypothetical protein CASFOL_029799 [Castilleja foliolosa]|uniref:Membrane-associated kinase regulator 1 n=1 Tax=Castilleja foliolosa TaxID=1961234 RepID=A0ABD3C8V3_9LAMI